MGRFIDRSCRQASINSRIVPFLTASPVWSSPKDVHDVKCLVGPAATRRIHCIPRRADRCCLPAIPPSTLPQRSGSGATRSSAFRENSIINCVSKRSCPDQTTRRRPHDRRALLPTRATDGHQTRACQAMDPTPGDTSTPCERPVSCTRRHNGRHRHAWVTMDARNLLHIYCFVCVGLDM